MGRLGKKAENQVRDRDLWITYNGSKQSPVGVCCGKVAVVARESPTLYSAALKIEKAP